MPYNIPRLDFNIVYACNIKCKGCISLSDFPRIGVEHFANLVTQIDYWHDYITPKVLTLFGGEPLLHPKLHNLIPIIKTYWPNTTIRLITNGYLLKKHDPKLWFNYKPFEIQVSIHRKDHEKILEQEIKKILKIEKGWKTKRIEHSMTSRDIIFYKDGFQIWKSKFKDFVTPYKINNGKLTPFTSNPVKAHSICGAPNTPVLYRGKLYKCPPIANILDIADKGVYNYEPIESEEGLKEFVENIGKPASICSMCPENKSHSFDHFNKENVYVKNIS